MLIKKHFFLLLLIISIISCEKNTENKSTYFGGRIINPKTNHVVLYSMEKVIDTFFLDAKNKFIGKVDNLNEGLYYFIHGNENQYIYLEPLDSLMLRLNTWDFDESLVFAGKGAERNNVLIDCFLENEKENKIFNKYNKLKPLSFKNKTDSITNRKLKRYNDYVESHLDETNGFKNILKVALTYPTYARIEKYPILYVNNSDKKEFPKINNTFYNYRKNININNDSLMYYPPYSQYIRNFLYNKTYSLGHTPTDNKYSSDFTIDLMNIIDSKIKSKHTKNAFLKQTLISHFFRKSSCEINLKTFEKFFELSSNKDDKSLVKKLMNDTNLIQKNKDLQDFNVIDFTNSKKSIKTITKDKNSLIFFWNSEYIPVNYISSRIKFLSLKYPKLKIILINIDKNKAERIHKLDIKNQFYLDSNSIAHNFLTSKIQRVILLNKNGVVENGYASISSRNLHHFIKELQKIK
ncbi:hypothetical protein [uncultured Polaribacter sp.]|uniref:hypothetical protein n=1 Tax=uncultured Polaribacter sp. TaxID=174711 RepID=UPI00260A534B|nr:hypothetical protein [uncultured Polaribacter sp.]